MSFSGALHRHMVTNDPRGWMRDLYRGVFGTPFEATRFNAANVFNRVGAVRRMERQPAFYLTDRRPGLP